MGELSVIQVVIVLVIALLVFGPARLPELGRQLGKGLRELKQQASGLGADLQRAVDDTLTPAQTQPSGNLTPPTEDDDRALLAGVVVTQNEPAPTLAASPPVVAGQDDELLQGVVVSGDTPAATASPEASSPREAPSDSTPRRQRRTVDRRPAPGRAAPPHHRLTRRPDRRICRALCGSSPIVAIPRRATAHRSAPHHPRRQRGFFTVLKVVSACAVIVALPVWLYQAYAYVIPAVAEQPRRRMLLTVGGIAGLFLLGAAFGYLLVLPVALKWLQSFNNNLFVSQLRASEYYGFVTTFTLSSGLMFEIPIAMMGLARLGVVQAATYVRQWRLAVVIIAVVAALLPGGDPMSMILLMVPQVGLYILGIWLAKRFGQPAPWTRAAWADGAPPRPPSHLPARRPTLKHCARCADQMVQVRIRRTQPFRIEMQCGLFALCQRRPLCSSQSCS